MIDRDSFENIMLCIIDDSEIVTSVIAESCAAAVLRTARILFTF